VALAAGPNDEEEEETDIIIYQYVAMQILLVSLTNTVDITED
jgi:hypothetical protein